MTFFAEIMERPEEERATIAMIGSVVVIVLLIAVWVGIRLVFGDGFAVFRQTDAQTAAANEGFSDLIQETKGSINEIKAKFNEIQNIQKESVGANAVGTALSPDPLSTSTIEAATKNFMRIYYGDDGELKVDVSELENTKMPLRTGFPY